MTEDNEIRDVVNGAHKVKVCPECRGVSDELFCYQCGDLKCKERSSKEGMGCCDATCKECNGSGEVEE